MKTFKSNKEKEEFGGWVVERERESWKDVRWEDLVGDNKKV